VSYLNLLDPLGELECAGAFYDGRGLGFIVQMPDILAFPDREGCSIVVNLEFRNGTWSLVHILISQRTKANPLAAFSVKVGITLPNVSKLYNGSRRRGQR